MVLTGPFTEVVKLWEGAGEKFRGRAFLYRQILYRDVMGEDVVKNPLGEKETEAVVKLFQEGHGRSTIALKLRLKGNQVDKCLRSLGLRRERLAALKMKNPRTGFREVE
jgi:hypothetical protein